MFWSLTCSHDLLSIPVEARQSPHSISTSAHVQRATKIVYFDSFIIISEGII